MTAIIHRIMKALLAADAGSQESVTPRDEIENLLIEAKNMRLKVAAIRMSRRFMSELAKQDMVVRPFHEDGYPTIRGWNIARYCDIPVIEDNGNNNRVKLDYVEGAI